jgi:hypothetical protein
MSADDSANEHDPVTVEMALSMVSGAYVGGRLIDVTRTAETSPYGRHLTFQAGRTISRPSMCE